MKTLLTTIALILLSTSAFSDNKEACENSAPPHSTGEIAWDVGMGVASAAAGGVAAAGGNIPGAVLGIANGTRSFIDAAKKYNENVRYEHERDNDDHYNEREKENDKDSWDRDY